MIYQQILKLWGCAKEYRISGIHKIQNKVLRNIVSASWYVQNCDIHSDLGLKNVVSKIRSVVAKREAKLNQHCTIEAIQLLDFHDSK